MRRKICLIRYFIYIVLAATGLYGCAGSGGSTADGQGTLAGADKASARSARSFSVPPDASVAWHPNILGAGAQKAATGAAVDAQLRQAIQVSLTRKGYSFVSATASWPDFFVGYVVPADTALDDNMISKHFDLMPRLRPNPDVNSVYRQGALVIDIIEPTAFRVLWRVSTPALLDADLDESQQAEHIQSQVEQLFSSFPDSTR